MGWANCGTDSKGREIGYAVAAQCDHEGCTAEIDRGLGYACGGWHGSSIGCEGYFCGDHLTHEWDPGEEGLRQFCPACAQEIERQRERAIIEAVSEALEAPTLAQARQALLAFILQWDETDAIPPNLPQEALADLTPNQRERIEYELRRLAEQETRHG